MRMVEVLVRNVNGYSNIFALLFPIARLDLLPICISHPISTHPLYSFSDRKSSIMDSYFQFLLWFHRLLIREFILISSVSVRDQASRASSLIVHSI